MAFSTLTIRRERSGGLYRAGFAREADCNQIPYSRGAVREPTWIGFGPDPNRARIKEFVTNIHDESISVPQPN